MPIQQENVGSTAVGGSDTAGLGNPKTGQGAALLAGIGDDYDVGGPAGRIRQIAVGGLFHRGNPPDFRTGGFIPVTGNEVRIESIGIGEIEPAVGVAIAGVERAAEDRRPFLGLGDRGISGERLSPTQGRRVVGSPRCRIIAVIGIGVHRQIKPDLLEIARTGNCPRLGPRLIQGRQQHSSQNGNNRDNDHYIIK